MSRSALDGPATDPTPIFEHFRGAHGTELLTVAVAHLGVFSTLADGPLEREVFKSRLGLKERPFVVLTTAIRAMGLIQIDATGRFETTSLASEHLTGGAFDVGGYIALAAQSPGVLEMLERLRTDRPAGADAADTGAAFIFRDGVESAMEHEASARFLTLALAGRAKNVAPLLAKYVDLSGSKVLLDVGGGTGIYAIAMLQANPSLRAIVWDRPEVLKIAREMADEHGVADRVKLQPGDMFADPVPPGADVVLLSNILHDWDVPECRTLVGKLAGALGSGGRLLVHDVFLDDSLGGPLPIALYSASLFTLTEGRAYSVGEYRAWLAEAGLDASAKVVQTLIHCGVVEGRKP